MVSITPSTKPIQEKQITHEWYVIDLKGKIVGRIAPAIALILQGKHKPGYVPYLDSGDNVIAINAKYVVLTGRKSTSKIYTRFSGYPGGLRRISFKELLEKKPEEIIMHAVSGMLPKNKLRDKRLKRLFVYANDNYPTKGKIETKKLTV